MRNAYRARRYSKERTRKFDLLLDDGGLDLVVRVGRDDDVARRRVNLPA